MSKHRHCGKAERLAVLDKPCFEHFCCANVVNSHSGSSNNQPSSTTNNDGRPLNSPKKMTNFIIDHKIYNHDYFPLVSHALRSLTVFGIHCTTTLSRRRRPVAHSILRESCCMMRSVAGCLLSFAVLAAVCPFLTHALPMRIRGREGSLDSKVPTVRR